MVLRQIPFSVDSIQILKKVFKMLIDLVRERSSVQLTGLTTCIVGFGRVLGFEIRQNIKDIAVIQSAFEVAGGDIQSISQPRLQSLRWIMDLLYIREDQWLSQINILFDLLEELWKNIFGGVLLVVLLHFLD